MVRNLIDHTMLTGNVYSLESVTFCINAINSRFISTVFKIKCSENGISRMLFQYDSRSSDIPSLFDSPESYVLLSATDKALVINRTEFQAQNVEV